MDKSRRYCVHENKAEKDTNICAHLQETRELAG